MSCRHPKERHGRGKSLEPDLAQCDPTGVIGTSGPDFARRDDRVGLGSLAQPPSTSCPRLLKRNARSTRKPRSASAPPSAAPAWPTRQGPGAKLRVTPSGSSPRPRTPPTWLSCREAARSVPPSDLSRRRGCRCSCCRRKCSATSAAWCSWPGKAPRGRAGGARGLAVPAAHRQSGGSMRGRGGGRGRCGSGGNDAGAARGRGPARAGGSDGREERGRDPAGACHGARGGLARHGRLRAARMHELVFGGVTRHVLREARLPVLFSG